MRKLLPICLALSACSSFAPHTMPVTVSSHPEAELFMDDERIGLGTATVDVPRNKPHRFSAQHGELYVEHRVGRHLSGMAVLDIVGGLIWLVPFIGLAAPGAWDLDETSVHLELPEAADGEVSTQ